MSERTRQHHNQINREKKETKSKVEIKSNSIRRQNHVIDQIEKEKAQQNKREKGDSKQKEEETVVGFSVEAANL